MKRFQSFLILFLLPAGFLLQSHAKIAGGDHYRIFINEKMVLEQFVTLPDKKASLSLGAANETDRLVVHYSHCGKVGAGRSIRLADAKGKMLKEWKFADSRESGMQLKVKEVRLILPKGSSASLYYASSELPNGKLLTTLTDGNGKTAKL